MTATLAEYARDFGGVVDRAGAARLLDVEPATVTRYRARGFPPPDGRVGRSPWWYVDTLRAWQANRPGRGIRPNKITM